MGENKTIQWTILGLLFVVLVSLFYTNYSLSEQLTSLQGDLIEVRAALHGLDQKVATKPNTSSTGSAVKTAQAKGTSKTSTTK